MLVGVVLLVATGRQDGALGLALAFPAPLVSSLRRIPAAADLAFATVAAAFMWATPYGLLTLEPAVAGTNLQPSRADTLTDLAAGVTGALLAALAGSMIASLGQLMRRGAGPAKARAESR